MCNRASVLLALVIAVGACERPAGDAPGGTDKAAPPPAPTAISAAPLGLPGKSFMKRDIDQSCSDIAIALGVAELSFEQKTELLREEFSKTFTPPRENELHDCQGLITGPVTNERYSTIASLLVDTILKNGTFADTTLVAVVKLLGEPFPSLGLHTAKNCIMLFGVNPSNSGNTWNATVVSVDEDHNCDNPGPTAIRTVLPIYRASGAPSAAVGRWVDTESYYYIALQCGNRLCVLGAQEPGRLPRQYDWRARAESDEQYLAKKNADSVVVPSHLIGNITTLTVQKRDSLSTYHNKEVPVATIKFRGNDDEARSQYARRYGLAVADLTRPITVYLKHEGGSDTAGWFIRYGDNTPWKPSHFMPASHAGAGARWRWTMDEGTWIQCVRGCCSGD